MVKKVIVLVIIVLLVAFQPVWAKKKKSKDSRKTWKVGDCVSVVYTGGGLFNKGQTYHIKGRITATGSSTVFVRILSISGCLKLEGCRELCCRDGEEIEVNIRELKLC